MNIDPRQALQDHRNKWTKWTALPNSSNTRTDVAEI